MTENISDEILDNFPFPITDGPIGGFTFKSGEKALIYQCGECGTLLKFNTGYNRHKREAHGAKDNVMFGWADGEPEWKELDITEEMIVV